MFLWNVVLAALFGLMLFVMLDIVSAGLLTTLVTVGVFFVVGGLIRYGIWGRQMRTEVAQESRAARPENHHNGATFVVELTDRERAELLRMLEHSRRASDAPVIDVRHALLDKIRMFGA